MSTKFFLLNKTNGSLELKGGFLSIPHKGYAPVWETDLKDPSIAYTVDRGLAEVLDKEPEEVKPEDVDLTVTNPYLGMTEAELLSSKANAEPAKPAATGTPIGQDTTVEIVPEPVKETPKKKGK